MKHIFISALFVLFAVFQYNDPDFYIWIPIYLVVAVAIFLYSRGIFNSTIFKALTFLYVLSLFLYYPDVVSWIQDGTPSIASSMQAESPFIEFIREFFGLAICALALGIYTYLSAKRSKS